MQLDSGLVRSSVEDPLRSGLLLAETKHCHPTGIVFPRMNGDNVVLHPSQYLSIYLVLCNAPEARLIQSDLARLMHS